MSAIFSVQNLQTFLRRKNLRPPSRGGPPGPERPPPPPPPKRGRSPPPERSPKGRDGRSATGAGALVSSIIMLLLCSLDQWDEFRLLILPVEPQNAPRIFNQPSKSAINNEFYAVAGVSCAGVAGASSAGAAGCALTFFFASRSFLIFSRRFCSSSMRTVRNLITGSGTRRRRSSS